MSILHHDIDDNVWIISHENFINKCYDQILNQDNRFRTKSIFGIVTPFRMDLEAEAVARSLETGLMKIKKKRKKNS